MSAIDLKKAWEAAVKPPEGWQGDLYFYNRAKQKIRYGYAPASGEKKGAVVLTGGYGEHIDLYYETIKQYQKMGYDVWGMDWQGQGLSGRDDPANPLKPGTQGLIRHVDDLDFFVGNIVKTRHDREQKLIMSTHSMGGHIGLLYLRQHPRVFDAAIMSAPMFDIYRLGLGRWARPLVRGIFNIASALGYRDSFIPDRDELRTAFGMVSGHLNNVFKRPMTLRGEFRELLRDIQPEARLGRPTFGWVAAAFRTIMPSLKENFLKSIKTPILIGSAENEDLVDNAAHERAARLLPQAKHVTIAGAGHGLWFENEEPFKNWWNQVDGFLSGVSPARSRAQENDKAGRDLVAARDLAWTVRGNGKPWGTPDRPQPA